MGRPTVRPVVRGDAWDLAANMRASDREELAAMYGPMSESAIVAIVSRAIGRSDLVWAAGIDGRLAGVFGVAPVDLIERIGSPWLLATDAATPGGIITLSREYVPIMRDLYPRLVNFVHSRNAKSARWLERLGFTIEPPAPAGVGGAMFRRFTMGYADV